MFSFVWCNIRMHVYVCLHVPVRVHYVSRMEHDLLPSFVESMIKLRWPSDKAHQALQG
jgi:maltodextrin utilization protein YvdJ